MKNKKVIMLISLITIISFIIGFSYAYFTTIVVGNDTASSNSTTLGTLQLTYNGEDSINMYNAFPNDIDSINFTIENTGSLLVSGYDLYFSNLVNEYIYDEMVYSISCVSSDLNPCVGIIESPIPKLETKIITASSIAPGVTHTYTLTTKFIDTGSEQNYNQRKKFYFEILINESEMSTPETTLVNRQGNESEELFWEYKDSITEIIIEDDFIARDNIIDSWDLTFQTNGKIIGYIIDDGLGSNTYKMYIQSKQEIFANPNFSNFFSGFSLLTSITNLDLINTTNTTNMNSLFENIPLITSLDLTNFNTSLVTDMGFMFSYSEYLNSFDISNFDTSLVTNMCQMFAGVDISLLDLSGFDVTNVTNMAGMFQESSITSLDLSLFNSINVTDMNQMFALCVNLTNLNLNGFKTDKVESFRAMFYGCALLNNLNFITFNTSNLTNMDSMFNNCDTMTVIDLSGFDTSKVTNMASLFQDCTYITTLNLSTFNTINVTSMWQMFALCTNLSSLNVSTFDVSNVEDMTAMFHSCTSLVFLDLSSFTFESLVEMRGMFYKCSGLTSLDLRNGTFTTVTNSQVVFTLITNGINILVKDEAARVFISNCLSSSSRSGNVTIYVP